MRRFLITGCVAAMVSGGTVSASDTDIHRDDLYALTSQALILGPSGTPVPNSHYISDVIDHYLIPNGYTGGVVNAAALPTPEQFSGASYTQGEADVLLKLLDLQQSEQLTSTDPTYLFGYSQSSTILSAVDSHLNDPEWMTSVLTSAGVPAQDAAGYATALSGIDPAALHLVLVGDPAADPGNGILPGFTVTDFTQQWLQWTGFTPMMGVATNDVLSPTDVYTVDGDNWAQATSFFGIPTLSSLQHLLYLGMDAGDFGTDPSGVVGNVTYFNADPSWWDQLEALFNSFLVSLGLEWGTPL